MRGRETEARRLLGRLAGAPVESEEVEVELRNIKDALDAQSKDGPFRIRELLHNGPSQNLRRTLLGIAAQFFQQICGINLIVSIRGNRLDTATDTLIRLTMPLTFLKTR